MESVSAPFRAQWATERGSSVIFKGREDKEEEEEEKEEEEEGREEGEGEEGEREGTSQLEHSDASNCRRKQWVGWAYERTFT